MSEVVLFEQPRDFVLEPADPLKEHRVGRPRGPPHHGEVVRLVVATLDLCDARGVAGGVGLKKTPTKVGYDHVQGRRSVSLRTLMTTARRFTLNGAGVGEVTGSAIVKTTVCYDSSGRGGKKKHIHTQKGRAEPIDRHATLGFVPFLSYKLDCSRPRGTICRSSRRASGGGSMPATSPVLATAQKQLHPVALPLP